MRRDIEVRLCDFNDEDDFKAVGELMNGYIADPMGGGTLLDASKRTLLAQALQARPTTVVLLACDGDIRCGLLVAFENFSTFAVTPMLNIHDVFVKPEYRGRSIGRLMFGRLEEIARERGCSRLTLEVRDDNVPAQSLYRSIGFGEISPNHYYWRKYL